jgi:hypothetical protein
MKLYILVRIVYENFVAAPYVKILGPPLHLPCVDLG